MITKTTMRMVRMVRMVWTMVLRCSAAQMPCSTCSVLGWGTRKGTRKGTRTSMPPPRRRTLVHSDGGGSGHRRAVVEVMMGVAVRVMVGLMVGEA